MLNEIQYRNLSNHLKAEEAAIKAVTEVESKGNGFLSPGTPKILFEGHVFWKELKKAGIDPAKHLKGNEDILYKSWTKAFYQGGLKEYARLERAKKIHEEAALRSTSWGAFQIMGFHFQTLGFKSAQDFVNAQKTTEGQVTSFLLFIRSNPRMLKALRGKEWEVFARLYNGSGYKENKYDIKLNRSYLKYGQKAKDVDSSNQVKERMTLP